MNIINIHNNFPIFYLIEFRRYSRKCILDSTYSVFKT